jgi:hypothetical protein
MYSDKLGSIKRIRTKIKKFKKEIQIFNTWSGFSHTHYSQSNAIIFRQSPNPWVSLDFLLVGFNSGHPGKYIVNEKRPEYYSTHCRDERFMYSQYWSGYSAAWKYVDRSWKYINHSHTHECGNWDWGRAIPLLEINKWDFRCSAA